jgi:hypothetical protein
MHFDRRCQIASGVSEFQIDTLVNRDRAYERSGQRLGPRPKLPLLSGFPGGEASMI